MRRWLIRTRVAIAVAMAGCRRGPRELLGVFSRSFPHWIPERLLDGRCSVDRSKASRVDGCKTHWCQALGNSKWPRCTIELVV